MIRAKTKPPLKPKPLSPEAAHALRWVEQYGDLIFDLCVQVLRDSSRAQLAFRAILKDLRKRHAAERFVQYERAWLLQGACAYLKAHADLAEPGDPDAPAAQARLDADPTPEARLERLDSYVHRLELEDRLLFALRDKYGLPYPEIAMALETPESSLKLRRGQALRSLQDWVWEAR